jgi:hypothetical protein
MMMVVMMMVMAMLQCVTGVYVVEFIGNGISSRALIRKGKLIVKENVTKHGHIFKVFDESYSQVCLSSSLIGLL